jgi:hypothetical protein
MKLKLVLDDWTDLQLFSVYRACPRLSLGDFHHGSAFPAEVVLTPDQEQELREALADGFRPVFYLVEGK